MIPKYKAIKSQKLRDSAQGRECTFNVVGVCNYDTAKTVLCHINTDGGKTGGKTDDISAAFGCSECHAWLDSYTASEVDRLFYSMRALIRTQRIWVAEGLLVVK